MLPLPLDNTILFAFSSPAPVMLPLPFAFNVIVGAGCVPTGAAELAVMAALTVMLPFPAVFKVTVLAEALPTAPATTSEAPVVKENDLPALDAARLVRLLLESLSNTFPLAPALALRLAALKVNGEVAAALAAMFPPAASVNVVAVIFGVVEVTLPVPNAESVIEVVLVLPIALATATEPAPLALMIRLLTAVSATVFVTLPPRFERDRDPLSCPVVPLTESAPCTPFLLLVLFDPTLKTVALLDCRVMLPPLPTPAAFALRLPLISKLRPELKVSLAPFPFDGAAKANDGTTVKSPEVLTLIVPPFPLGPGLQSSAIT